jgi:Fe-S-cluster-containing hydrogenase component 2
MDRYEYAKSLFEQGAFFKIVCGAGNEDPVEVRRLATVYTLAGAAGIDLSANPEIVISAVEGISRAESLALLLDRKITFRPFITVSVGIAGDPHVRKASINPEICTQCMCCVEACEQDAVDKTITVIEERCIGCGKCAEICQEGAVSFYTRRINLATLLPECLRAGAEMIELHAVTLDDAAVLTDWKLIDSLVPDNYISMCLDRSLLSDTHLVKRISDAYSIRGNRMIIQADGAPMSGGDDDFHTTLQAIATADIVSKSKLPVKILASGGTNSKTKELADLCGVSIHGVSIGTFARKLVKSYISTDAFDHDIGIVTKAVSVAQDLVRRSTQGKAGI